MKVIDRVLTALSILAATITVAFVTGVIVYNEAVEQRYTIVVQLKDGQDPFVVLPQVIPAASKIAEVHTVDKTKNEYEVQVRTSQSRKRLLDFILHNKVVESAR